MPKNNKLNYYQTSLNKKPSTMKRFTITALLITFGLLGLHAQRSSVYIGANGGVNFSKFHHTQDLQELYTSSNAIFGLNGGLTAGMVLGNWTLSTGLQYIQKGGEYQTDNFSDGQAVGFFTGREKLHYLSVPLLLGYRYELVPGVDLSLAIGPSFNVGLGGTLDETTEFFGSDEVELDNYPVAFGNGINEDYRPMQVGFQLSPGLVFSLNDRSKFIANVTWDLGTADAFNPRYKKANTFFDDYKGNQINRSTIFTLGYEYHFSIGDRY